MTRTLLVQTPTLMIAAACALPGLAACTGGPDATYTLIDDMEGTPDSIEWSARVGTPGGWNSFTDVECDHLLPMPGSWSYEPLPASYETRPGIISTHAARLRTTAPLDNTWGAGMGLDFAVLPRSATASGATVAPACPTAIQSALLSPAVPVDLTAFSGISFWGKTAGGTGTVWLRINDSNTDPRGGICDPATSDSAQRACFNSFRYSIDLTSTFTQYTVDFSQLKQGVFGHQATPSVLDRGRIFGLVFEVDTPGGFCPPPSICAGVPPTLTFDTWIDDLYFVNR